MSEDPLCIRAETFVAKHEIVGIQRVHVHKIGAHWWNRRSLPVSGKYVHGLWRGILDRQGFVLSRYIRAIVIECKSEPWRNRLNEHNKRFCNTDPLLPTMNDNRLEYGSISKTHMIFGLKCIQAAIPWDDADSKTDPSPMMATGKSKTTILDHLENGVHCLVLREAANADEEGVHDLMLSENLDNDHTMPEHEIGLLKHVCGAIESAMKDLNLTRDTCWAVGGQGSKLYRQVVTKVKASLGGRWSDEDIIACYNLGMTTEPKVLQTVIDCHQLSVNPAMKMVRPDFFDFVAKVDYNCQDARCALVIRQYMSKLSLKNKQGKVFIASEISNKQVMDLTKPESAEIVGKCDAFLKNMMDHYGMDTMMKDPALCGICMKCKTQLFTRVGSLLLLSKPEDVASFLPKVEAKFVLALTSSLPSEHGDSLPPLIYEAAQKILDEDLQAEAKKREAGSVKDKEKDQGPKPLTLSVPVVFSEDGRAEETPEMKAGKEQFTIGMRVELAKKLKSIGMAGREGVIKGFLEKDARGARQLQAKVAWNDDEEGEDGEDAAFPKESELALSHLRFAGPPKKKAKTGDAKEDAKQEIPKDIIPFEFYDESTAMIACMAMARQELWQMYLKTTVGLKDKLDVKGTVDHSNKAVVVAKEDFTKGSLILVPYSSANFVVNEPTHQKSVSVKFTMKDSVETFWIPFAGSISWDKDKSILSPFWAVGFVKEGSDDKANMTLKRVDVKLGPPGKVEGVEFKDLQATIAKDRGTFSFQVLVNKMKVKEGEPLLR